MKYMVTVPGADQQLTDSNSLCDAINKAVRWRIQLSMVVIVVDNETGEVIYGL